MDVGSDIECRHCRHEWILGVEYRIGKLWKQRLGLYGHRRVDER